MNRGLSTMSKLYKKPKIPKSCKSLEHKLRMINKARRASANRPKHTVINDKYKTRSGPNRKYTYTTAESSSEEEALSDSTEENEGGGEDE